jgi:hypothetical protein
MISPIINLPIEPQTNPLESSVNINEQKPTTDIDQTRNSSQVFYRRDFYLTKIYFIRIQRMIKKRKRKKRKNIIMIKNKVNIKNSKMNKIITIKWISIIM